MAPAQSMKRAAPVKHASRRLNLKREKQKEQLARDMQRQFYGDITPSLAKNLSPAGKAFDDIWVDGIIPQVDSQTRQSLKLVCGFFRKAVDRYGMQVTSSRIRKHYSNQVFRTALLEAENPAKLKACFLPSQRLHLPLRSFWYAFSVKHLHSHTLDLFQQFCALLDVDPETPLRHDTVQRSIRGAPCVRTEYSYLSRTSSVEMTLTHDPRFDYDTLLLQKNKIRLGITGEREAVKRAEEWLAPERIDDKGVVHKDKPPVGVYVKGLCKGRREYN